VPIYIRHQVEAELLRRRASGEPLHETMDWLGGTGAPVGDAVEMLVEAGLTQEQAEEALMAHEDWANLIRVVGGFRGEYL
jgi:hypothetical protein